MLMVDLANRELNKKHEPGITSPIVTKKKMKDLSLHILDIAHNSIRAKASQIHISVNRDTLSEVLSIVIKDNGYGMTPEQLAQVTDSFYTSRTTRKVGLGIPLLKQKAEDCEGDLNIISTVGIGTDVIVSFKNNHIDLPELGDIASVISGLCCSAPLIRFIFHYKDKDTNYTFDTQEVLEALDGIPINTPEVELFIREMISGQL